MALTFPLSLAQFQDKLKISEASFFLNEPRKIDRTAGGSILSASLGAGVWKGSFTLAPQSRLASNPAETQALLSVLDRAGSSFLVYDPSRSVPASGGTSNGTIGSISGTDRRVLTITGGPTLTVGDLFSFTYGSNPIRYSLHSVVDISGSDIEVRPFIPIGASVGATVTFNKPVMKAILEPNPDYGAHRPVITAGSSFGFVQTLR